MDPHPPLSAYGGQLVVNNNNILLSGQLCKCFSLKEPLQEHLMVRTVEAKVFKFGDQCLQAVLLFFSLNVPVFQYFACIFSIFQSFGKSSI
jgi:hypothetical protein